MSISLDLSFERTLPLPIFEQLEQLVRQMAQEVGTEAFVLTEAVLSSIPVQPPQEMFTLVISQQFSVLLVASADEEAGRDEGAEGKNPIFYPKSKITLRASTERQLLQTPPPYANSHKSGNLPKRLPKQRTGLETEATQWVQNHATSSSWKDPSKRVAPKPNIESSLSCDRTLLNVKLTFDPEEITLFLGELSQLLQHHPQAHEKLQKYSQTPQLNDARLQSKFTLLLLSILVPPSEPSTATVYPSVSVCQPIENALHQQIAHERLLNQLTSQIRQSLDLPVIIATVVEQVREFLQLDRLVIYQFEKTKEQIIQNSTHTPLAIAESPLTGCVVYEARSTESIPSVLNYKEEKCFIKNSHCWNKYCRGFTLAIADVEKAYFLSPCLLNFLKVIQVRAKMVAPVVFQEKLWGLLIAHQCTESRLWLESEKNLLRSIAEQLAIAIHQAELMSSLKQEKQTLEQRVVERTQALYDASIAAQAASRAKSEFLATMSHELRTPLTSIIGMSTTLLRWPFGELSQRQRQYLQTIHDSGEHLLALIEDILELSQIEAGKAVLNISEFSLTALAEASIRSFFDKARRQEVDLTLDLRIKPAFHLSADPRRVGKILWNLLSNAIKFTPEGGQVTLRIWSEKGYAVLQVEDTGIGISEENLSLLFEKFQQLDTPLQRCYEGTGLGLALTKQLVELHRGRIEVESTVGEGSIFSVWLPSNYE